VVVEAYQRVINGHGLLSALLGLFFSWLLSFPVFGSYIYAFPEVDAVNNAGVRASFALFYGLGLLGYGIWGRRFLVDRRYRAACEEVMGPADNTTGEGTIDTVVMSASCIVCFGLAVAFAHLPYGIWPWLVRALGLVSGVFTVTCASEMARTVPRDELGRAFALSMAIANTAFYIHGAFLVRLGLSLTLYISSLWLLLSFLAVRQYGLRLPRTCPGKRPDYAKATSGERHRFHRFFISLAVVLASTSVILGFAHGAIFPNLNTVGDFARFYSVVPYILTCLLCGWIADYAGRLKVANMGFVWLGLSMPLLSLVPLHSIPGYMIAQTLIQGGYACIHVFLWVSLSDLASLDRTSLYYGIGLGLNVWLMSFGEFFVARFLPIGEVGFSNISLVAALILFLGIIGLAKLEETLTYRETLPESVYPEPTPAPELSCNPGQPYQMDTAIDNYVLDLLATEYSLTPRELEVIELLLEGMKNDEIQEKLFISQGTLKTHLRHIFRKLDVQNRKELLVSFTRFLVSSNGARKNAEPR